LKNGAWSHRTPASYFDRPTISDWSGITQLLAGVWEQPLWGVVAAGGIAVVIFGIVLVNLD
jgi:hypothetical protein